MYNTVLVFWKFSAYLVHLKNNVVNYVDLDTMYVTSTESLMTQKCIKYLSTHTKWNVNEFKLTNVILTRLFTKPINTYNL